MTKAKRRNPHGRRKAKAVTLAPSMSAMPTTWDQGATGAANRAMLVEEAAVDHLDIATGKPAANPNGVKRMRRVDMLEVWHRKGTITTAGYNAAERLRDAYDATERTPGWPDNDRVQSSPKPDHAVTIQTDRLSRFIAVMGLVQADDKMIIGVCVLDRGTPARIPAFRGRRYVAGMEHLRAALDRLASALGGLRGGNNSRNP